MYDLLLPDPWLLHEAWLRGLILTFQAWELYRASKIQTQTQLGRCCVIIGWWQIVLYLPWLQTNYTENFHDFQKTKGKERSQTPLTWESTGRQTTTLRCFRFPCVSPGPDCSLALALSLELWRGSHFTPNPHPHWLAATPTIHFSSYTFSCLVYLWFYAGFWKLWEFVLWSELLKQVSVCAFRSKIHFSTIPYEMKKKVSQPSVTCMDSLFILFCFFFSVSPFLSFPLSLSSSLSLFPSLGLSLPLSLNIIYWAMSQGMF